MAPIYAEWKKRSWDNPRSDDLVDLEELAIQVVGTAEILLKTSQPGEADRKFDEIWGNMGKNNKPVPGRHANKKFVSNVASSKNYKRT